MKASALPTKFSVPFASSAGTGYIRPIPSASQIGITAGAASLPDGFPPLTFLAVGSGGIPPSGQDFNGILNQITAWNQWQALGGTVPFDQSFANTIGGYPYGAIVQSTTASKLWFNTADNNITNPDGGGAANWVMLFGGPTSIKTRLQANTTFYVAANGSDTNPGSQPSPWATLQFALDTIAANYDFNGYNVTIQLADGNYASAVLTRPLVGGGVYNLIINGNATNPAAVVIQNTSNLMLGALGGRGAGVGFSVQNLQFINTINVIGGGYGLYVDQNASVRLSGPVSFGAAYSGQLSALNGGTAIVDTPAYTIAGGGQAHLFTYNGSRIVFAPSAHAVTITGTPAFSLAFAYATDLAVIAINNQTTWGGSATGPRYYAAAGGDIQTQGAPNSLPGSSAGTATTGYVG